MNKKILHEISNYLHQIISHTEAISNVETSSQVAEYTQKIQNAAYSIDAIISDTTKKNVISTANNSINEMNFEQFNGMKVMIVDDIDDNIEIMKNIFSILSCEIVSAKSGEKAIELYRDGFTPEFVCMDMIMPGINGAETTIQLKELGSSAFFMAVSALKNQPNEIKNIFNYWLPKPFTMENIICALNKYKSSEQKTIQKEKFDLKLSVEIKDKLLLYAHNGAYTSIKKLLFKLPNTQSKQFIEHLLHKMDFKSIINSIVSS